MLKIKPTFKLKYEQTRDDCEWISHSNSHIPPISMQSTMPSVLWRCWLGGRKGIRPVKNRVVGWWRGYLSAARCRLAYSPADATATQSVASVKSKLVLPFWYRLTWVVPEKGPLNGCVYVCVCVPCSQQDDATQCNAMQCNSKTEVKWTWN